MPSHCLVSVKLPYWREKNATTLVTFYIVLYSQICFQDFNTQLRCLACKSECAKISLNIQGLFKMINSVQYIHCNFRNTLGTRIKTALSLMI